MEGALHDERADMAPAHQARSAIPMPKPKLKLCTPTIRIQGKAPSPLRLPCHAPDLPAPPMHRQEV
jgi:hypothetical protein